MSIDPVGASVEDLEDLPTEVLPVAEYDLSSRKSQTIGKGDKILEDPNLLKTVEAEDPMAARHKHRDLKKVSDILGVEPRKNAPELDVVDRPIPDTIDGRKYKRRAKLPMHRKAYGSANDKGAAIRDNREFIDELEYHGGLGTMPFKYCSIQEAAELLGIRVESFRNMRARHHARFRHQKVYFSGSVRIFLYRFDVIQYALSTGRTGCDKENIDWYEAELENELPAVLTGVQREMARSALEEPEIDISKLTEELE